MVEKCSGQIQVSRSGSLMDQIPELSRDIKFHSSAVTTYKSILIFWTHENLNHV